MHPSLSLPQISTNVRFAATALFAPDLAGAWAERLFLTPPQPKIERRRDQHFWGTCRIDSPPTLGDILGNQASG